MSTTTTSYGGATGGSSSAAHKNYLSNLGLGYAIAIALGFLMLLSTLLLASYVCCRTSRTRSRRQQQQQHHHHHQGPNPNSSDGVVLPRIIFVAEDENGNDENAIVGLDPAVINSYPKSQFYKSSSDLATSESLCSICLCEYRDSEMLRTMPDCRHSFHLLCLDAWLKLNGSCPVCRNSPLPTPLSTPLAEVVPLSQYQR